jgi:hypothetical protein
MDAGELCLFSALSREGLAGVWRRIEELLSPD